MKKCSNEMRLINFQATGKSHSVCSKAAFSFVMRATIVIGMGLAIIKTSYYIWLNSCYYASGKIP